MDFISDEVKAFLRTPEGKKAFRELTPGPRKSDLKSYNRHKAKRRNLKKNLIAPPKNFQRLFDLKTDIERIHARYKASELGRKKIEKSKKKA